MKGYASRWINGLCSCSLIMLLSLQGSASTSIEGYELFEALQLSKEHFPYTPAFRPDRFLFGEEYEYWLYPPDDNTPVSYSHLQVEIWKDKLEKKLNAMNIPASAYQLSMIQKTNAHGMITTGLEANIGNWQTFVFIDNWSYLSDTPDEYTRFMLEVNASPYKEGQHFQVNNKEYSVYDLMQWFITDIADEMELGYASGHKHLDLENSIGSNLELLFRLLVDVENKAWLANVFGCEHDSGMSGQSFIYIAQADNAPAITPQLHRMLTDFNEKMLDSAFSKSEEFYPALQRFDSFWEDYFSSGGRVPAGIRIRPAGEEPASNEDAMSGKVVTSPVSGTLEFRFLPTAQTGNEARLINQLLTKWIGKLRQDQLERKPVFYKRYDPLKPGTLPPSYRFNRFLTTLGLSPKEYQIFLRQGCEAPPEYDQDNLLIPGKRR